MNLFIVTLSLLSTVYCGNSISTSEGGNASMDSNATTQTEKGMEETNAPVAASHDSWDQLLKAHVKGDLVDYKGFMKDKDKLHAYCAELSVSAPAEGASTNEILAYYINLYNAQTVKLIIDNYPVKSIKDLHPTLKIPGVNSVWHITKFMVGDEELSLNDVEHNVLRKMGEPRIHFAINCASYSCPPLRKEAYTAEKIDAQLTDQAKTFLNTAKFNEISQTNPKLSSIFNWFSGDFKTNGTIIPFLNKYSSTKIDENAQITYLDYNWNLNDVK